MKSSVIPDQACSKCGYVMDRASEEGGHPPSEGDFSICFRCGHLTVFDESLLMREVTDNDLLELCPEDADYISRAQALIRSKRLMNLQGDNQ